MSTSWRKGTRGPYVVVGERKDGSRIRVRALTWNTAREQARRLYQWARALLLTGRGA